MPEAATSALCGAARSPLRLRERECTVEQRVDYLDWASQHNTIAYNRIRDNGRAGIAIDSSRLNEIRNNEIHSNAAGGVMLYRNCQEPAQQTPPNLTEKELENYRWRPLAPLSGAGRG